MNAPTPDLSLPPILQITQNTTPAPQPIQDPEKEFWDIFKKVYDELEQNSRAPSIVADIASQKVNIAAHSQTANTAASNLTIEQRESSVALPSLDNA